MQRTPEHPMIFLSNLFKFINDSIKSRIILERIQRHPRASQMPITSQNIPWNPIKPLKNPGASHGVLENTIEWGDPEWDPWGFFNDSFRDSRLLSYYGIEEEQLRLIGVACCAYQFDCNSIEYSNVTLIGLIDSWQRHVLLVIASFF